MPVRLSTSPFGEGTHWKQTVFYLTEPLAVKKNDVISGSIAVKKAAENVRNLDIKLSVHLKNTYGESEQILFYKLN